MYARIDELNAYQTKNNITDSELAERIGIDILTLKKVKANQQRIFKSTEAMVNGFLDNPQYIDLEKESISELLLYKTENHKSWSEISETIGLSGKTLYNAVKNPHAVSSGTRKLILNFLKKVC